jgi:hypothetical protein
VIFPYKKSAISNIIKIFHIFLQGPSNNFLERYENTLCVFSHLHSSFKIWYQQLNCFLTSVTIAVAAPYVGITSPKLAQISGNRKELQKAKGFLI